jgi:hypothetical protein
MKRWSNRTWIVLGGSVALLFLGAISVGLYLLIRSGATRPLDNLFGDQHLKTTVALVELHKVRYGLYPASLSELKFTGEWDAIALGSVSYCASPGGKSYYVEVSRGWAGKPELRMPEEFWRGTGFNRSLGPSCH